MKESEKFSVKKKLLAKLSRNLNWVCLGRIKEERLITVMADRERNLEQRVGRPARTWINDIRTAIKVTKEKSDSGKYFRIRLKVTIAFYGPQMD